MTPREHCVPAPSTLLLPAGTLMPPTPLYSIRLSNNQSPVCITPCKTRALKTLIHNHFTSPANHTPPSPKRRRNLNSIWITASGRGKPPSRPLPLPLLLRFLLPAMLGCRTVRQYQAAAPSESKSSCDRCEIVRRFCMQSCHCDNVTLFWLGVARSLKSDTLFNSAPITSVATNTAPFWTACFSSATAAATATGRRLRGL